VDLQKEEEWKGIYEKKDNVSVRNGGYSLVSRAEDSKYPILVSPVPTNY